MKSTRWLRNWQNTVMSAINPRTGRKYAETYIRTINSRLSAIFNYAVMFYSLGKNPCIPAGFMGKKKAGKMKFWTLAEFQKAIAYVTKPGFRVALMVLYWAGLRVGECLALTPADVLPSKVIGLKKRITVKRERISRGLPIPTTASGMSRFRASCMTSLWPILMPCAISASAIAFSTSLMER
jgi:integrase